MNTLTYGLKVPASPDSGSEFFPAIEDNFTQLDAHTHDGVTSAKLTPGSTAVNVQNILAASWSATSGGTYRQLVTIPSALTNSPSSLTYDTVGIQFRLSTGEIVYPTVEKVSGTTYYVYTNDNSLAYKAIYFT